MPIVAQDIIDRVRFGLDAEGSDHYDDTRDIIPAINSAVEWLVAITNSAFGQKKMGEEVFQDLVQARVFQASDYSRVYFDSTILGHELWTILGVYTNPTVREGGLLTGTFNASGGNPQTPVATIVFPTTTDLSVVNAGDNINFTYTDITTGNVVTNTFLIIGVNNTLKTMLVNTFPVVYLADQMNTGDTLVASNPPVYLNQSTTATPIINTLATPELSVYRPDLAHVSSQGSAKRLTIEEWAKNDENPFAAGNSILSLDCDTLEYAYLNYAEYSAPDVPYSVPREIEVKPTIANKVVTVFYAKKPTTIVLATDSIEFPGFFANWIFNKTLQYIAYKQGDGTTINTVTTADINMLLQSIT